MRGLKLFTTIGALGLILAVGACKSDKGGDEAAALAAVPFLLPQPPTPPPPTPGNTYTIGDLSVTTADTGTGYTLNITVSGAQSETLEVYFSSNTTITPVDYAAGTLDTVDGGDISGSITVPTNLVPGASYYIGLLDSSGKEVAVSTNQVSIPPYVPVNTYSIGTLTVTSAYPGANYTLNVTVTGTVSETLDVYFSTDATITTADTAAGTVSTVSGANISSTIVVPSSLSIGTSYYIGLLNSGGTQVAVSGNTVAITAPPPNTYSIGALSPTTAPENGTYTLGVTVTGTNSETLNVYYSTDNVITIADTAAGTVSTTSGGNISSAIPVPSSLTFGTTYYIGLLDASNAQVAVSTNTVTIGVDSSSAVSLTVGAAETPGTLANDAEVDVFSFTTEVNTMYAIVWNDSAEGDASKTEDIVVSVYADNGYTTVFERWTAGALFTNLDGGYTTLRLAASLSAGTYYIRVKCKTGGCGGGSYGIRVVNMSKPLTVGGGYAADDHLAAATPAPLAQSSLRFYAFNAVNGTPYTITFEDFADKDAGSTYNQNVTATPEYISSIAAPGTGITLSSGVFSSGFTTPQQFTASQDSAVFIKINLTATGADPGFHIKVD